MKGNSDVITRLNEALKLELGAINQYWLHFRTARQLGIQKARQEGAQGIDRRDASRRSSDRPHHLPRGPSEPAACRAADDRREHQGSSRVRSEGRAHRPRPLQAVTRNLPRPRRLRDDGAVRRPAEGRGRSHRFPRDAARSSRQASASRTTASSTPKAPTTATITEHRHRHPRAGEPAGRSGIQRESR